MGIREALRTVTLAIPGVGERVEGRMYPLQLPPEPTLPAIVYQRISTARFPTHDSGSGETLTKPRFQLDCWALDEDEADALGGALVSGLDGARTTAEGIRIQAAFVANDVDGREPQTGRFRRRVEVLITHAE